MPPDPNGFFPDDLEGGKRLDALFQAVDKDQRSDEETLSTVRQGFRRTTQSRSVILRWIGNRYVWGRDPQNSQAIEIMYHAAPLEQHYAVYFGLSVIYDKTPNILRTLADICMQGEEVARIAWGVSAQREQLLTYITPYQKDDDPDKRELVDAIVMQCKYGTNVFDRWRRERRLKQANADLRAHPGRFTEILQSGESSSRYEILETIVDTADASYLRMNTKGILDTSFLAPLQVAATDTNPEVRSLVAQVVGARWLWSAPEDDANAVQLLLTLTSDRDRQVRHSAISYGLLSIRNKSGLVLRRLIELALTDHDGTIRTQINLRLSHPKLGQLELIEGILREHLPRAKSDARYATSLCQLYREILQRNPPSEWGLTPADDPSSHGFSAEMASGAPRDALVSHPPREGPVAPAPPARQEAAPNTLTGRILDLKGDPAVEAQVALCANLRGVSIRGGELTPTNAGRESLITKTDAEGRFSFPTAPDEYHIIAASEAGYACVECKDHVSSGDIRLSPWGRVEGTLRIGPRAAGDMSLRLVDYSPSNGVYGHVDYADEVRTSRDGSFVFEKVPIGWMAVGHIVPLGGSGGVYTKDMFIHVPAGETVKVTVGGVGRPVIGRLVPPEGYTFSYRSRIGLYTMSTVRPERPRPDHFEQMTIRARQQWYEHWRTTPQAQAYDERVRHDPGRRLYGLDIERDGFFRIDDVVPGKYRTIIQERIARPGHRRETGLYYGTFEIPAMSQSYTDEPLDLGNLVVRPCQKFEAGDVAPPFVARTLEGKDIRLVDYRGKFLLLNFWNPGYDPGLADLKRLYANYGSTGKLQFIGFAGFGTLREVEDYIGEHGIEWPQVYCGENWDATVVEQYRPPGPSHNLLMDPEGKIIAIGISVSERSIKATLERAGRNAVR